MKYTYRMLIVGLYTICFLYIYLYINYNGIIYVPSDFKKIDIVIAVYEEDISWISLLPKELYNHIHIYNKGSKKNYNFENSSVINIPNVGYEAHTYLYHIVNNYNSLADRILFLPGTAWTRSYKRHKTIRTINYLISGNDSVAVGLDVPFLLSQPFYDYKRNLNSEKNFRINSYPFTNENNRKHNSDMKLTPSMIYPYENWFNHHFKEEMRCLTYNGIFAASRNNIMKRSREFYQRLIREIDYPQSEAGHYIERSWTTITSIPQSQCIQHIPNFSYFIFNDYHMF